MAACKSCGMEIEFIEGPNGKKIPSQRIKNVYRRVASFKTKGGDWTVLEVAERDPSEPWYVSHFETCPNASEHSKGKR